MPHYFKLGQLPPKRHIQFRRPDGGLYAEEVFGTEGFVGPTSTLYHIHPPTQVTGWKTLYSTKPEYVETDVMRMRHARSAQMKPKGDPVTGRVVLFGNADCEMAVCVPARPMEYHYRNAMGDECIFVHFGRGTVWTSFGTLPFREKDYIIIPKGVTYRMEFESPARGSDEPRPRFLVIETANGSHIAPPPRYLSKQSAQLLEHAPFCERDFRLPELPLTFDQAGKFEVRIKARDRVHSYIYDHHPLDTVGWDGCYYPYIFNIDDFSPIVGKHHLPPPTHQTFEAHNFVICSFCPRPLDFHPQAIVVPYNHSNLDSDEVLYYVEGNYKARRGIEVASLTLHPQGIPHGPHPGTVEASIGATHTNELAVMCDTFRPLFPTKAALGIDDPKYPKSWHDHVPARDGQHAPDGSFLEARRGADAHVNGAGRSAANGRPARGVKPAKAGRAAKKRGAGSARAAGGDIDTWS
ncbi:MAG TPA: homogentisate 1,2-dioxygenase [Phycisphaerales bacterium]|nr:homogentisate 1,2-dioxygenase [Phycisphaerales bacterium]HMP37500.1 homogentisate 1,2-dioxygenase [Phycisphaerales bacterium]